MLNFSVILVQGVLFWFLLGRHSVSAFNGKILFLTELHAGDGTPHPPVRAKMVQCGLLAAQHINDRDASLVEKAVVDSLRENFTVSLYITDTWGTPSIATRHTTQYIEKGIHGIVGPQRSSESGPVSLIAGFSSIPTVSYWSVSEKLSDKTTYPYFSRAIIGGKAQARATLGVCQALGWNSIAVLFIDDLWGSSMAEEFSVGAPNVNINVLTVQKYTNRNRESMSSAMGQLRRSQAAVVVFMIFGEDLEMMAEAADSAGLIGEGHVWINGQSFQSPAQFVSASSNPERMRSLLEGWVDVIDAPLHGDLGVRFRSVFDHPSTPSLAHPIIADFAERAEAVTPPDLCGYIYDAMWAVALGIERSLGAGGELEQEQVLGEIRRLHMQASTGRVQFHPNGNRDEADLVFLVKSWVMGAVGGVPTVVPTDVATYSFGAALEYMAEPTWPGGAVGWAAIPSASRDCPPGSARSTDSAVCEPCSPGTFAPDAGMTQCLPCLSAGYASEPGQRSCTRCPGNREMPPNPVASVSAAECVCKEGYLVGCTMQIWQLLLVLLVAVLVPLVLAAARKVLRRPSRQEAEAMDTQQRILLIRTCLNLTREYGFLMPKERKTWLQRMRFRPTTRLNAKLLENLARLTLMLSFEVESVDFLALQMMMLGDNPELWRQNLRAMGDSADDKSLLPRSKSDASAALSIHSMHSALFFDLDCHSSAPYGKLCLLLRQVSEQLLDPDWPGPGEEHDSLERLHRGAMRRLSESLGVPVHHRNAIFEDIRIPPASAQDRFDFFRHRVGKLQIWEQGHNFAALKESVQGLMDGCRKAMDAQYCKIVQEDGGADLVAFRGPELPDMPRRQDHHRVKAIRVDEEAATEIRIQQRVQLEGVDRNPRRSSLGIMMPDVVAELGSQHSLRQPGRLLLPGSPVGSPLRSLESPTRAFPSSASLGQEHAALIEAMMRDDAASERERQHRQRSGGVWPGHRKALAGAGSGGFAACVEDGDPHAWRTRRGSLLSRDSGLQRSSPVDENVFVDQLCLRAGLLNAGFQAKVRTVTDISSRDLLFTRSVSSDRGAGEGVGGHGLKRDAESMPQGPQIGHGGGEEVVVVSSAPPKMEAPPCDDADITVAEGPIKTKTRMLEKLKQYVEEIAGEGGRVEEHLPLTAYILDPIRSAVVCANPRSILEHAEWLIENGEKSGLPVVRTKNKFVGDSSEYDGYRDLMLSVLYTGEEGLRIIGEIQLHDARMYPLKVKMHRLYKVKRATAANNI